MPQQRRQGVAGARPERKVHRVIAAAAVNEAADSHYYYNGNSHNDRALTPVDRVAKGSGESGGGGKRPDMAAFKRGGKVSQQPHRP